MARLRKEVSAVYSEDVPLWVAVPVVLVIVATAVVAWMGTRRAARSLFDARKAKRVSFLFAAVLTSWLVLAFLIVFLPRPENAPATIGAVIVLTWNLALISLGYGLRFFSRTYREVVDCIPQQLLLAFQPYRPVGAIFLPLMVMGILPAFFAVPAGGGGIIA